MHEPLRMQTVCCRDEFGVNKTLGFTLFDVKPSVCFAIC